MDYRQEYDKWCNDPYFDDQTREELKAIAGDDKEIEDRFYRTLEFGTAGLRGVIGAGTNRMNIYTGPSGDTGTGKLYSGTGRTGERCGNRT